MLETIRIIERNAREAIEAERHVFKVHSRFEHETRKALEPMDIYLFCSNLRNSEYKSRSVIEEISVASAGAVVRIFAHQIGVSEDVVLAMPGVEQAVKDAAKSLDLEGLYNSLHKLVHVDSAEAEESRKHARKLEPYFRDSVRKGDALVFSIWATVKDYGNYNYDFYTAEHVREIANGLRHFMSDRDVPFISYLRTNMVGMLNDTVKSRARFVLLQQDERNYIEAVTFKSKIEFRLHGEIGRDFVAWLRKYCVQYQEAS